MDPGIPDFDKNEKGLLPVIVQDAETDRVLMLAYTNRQAWEKTMQTGRATFWSRSRNSVWVKGESSGNVQNVREVYVDCDADTLLYKVEQVGGAACHEGYPSCFYRKITAEGVETSAYRVVNPEDLYSNSADSNAR